MNDDSSFQCVDEIVEEENRNFQSSKAVFKDKIKDTDLEEDGDGDGDVHYLPPPRSLGVSSAADSVVGIQFTARAFPTPLRESKVMWCTFGLRLFSQFYSHQVAEEDDWVARNGKHLQKHGVLAKSVTRGASGSSFCLVCVGTSLMV